MKLLDKAAILAAKDLKTEDVDVPEWGGAVRVSTMTGTGREALSQSLAVVDGKTDMSFYREKMLAACIVGEDGAPLFSSGEVALLAGKSAAALARVFAVAERLNGIQAGAVEEAAGN